MAFQSGDGTNPDSCNSTLKVKPRSKWPTVDDDAGEMEKVVTFGNIKGDGSPVACVDKANTWTAVQTFPYPVMHKMSSIATTDALWHKVYSWEVNINVTYEAVVSILGEGAFAMLLVQGKNSSSGTGGPVGSMLMSKGLTASMLRVTCSYVDTGVKYGDSNIITNKYTLWVNSKRFTASVLMERLANRAGNIGDIPSSSGYYDIKTLYVDSPEKAYAEPSTSEDSTNHCDIVKTPST